MSAYPSRGNQQIYILTGDIGAGKSSFLIDLAGKIRDRDLRVAGFTAPSKVDEDSNHSYEISDLYSEKTLPLASRIFSDGWLKTGNFFFNPEGLRLGNEILMDPEISKNDIVIVIRPAG